METRKNVVKGGHVSKRFCDREFNFFFEIKAGCSLVVSDTRKLKVPGSSLPASYVQR